MCVSELDFDLCKALEDVSFCVDDLPLPPPLTPSPSQPMSPPPVEAELPQPEPVSFSDLPTRDTPTLQHITKYRPRRTKKAKPSRAAVRHKHTQLNDLTGMKCFRLEVKVHVQCESSS